MSAGKYNIKVEQGTTYTKTFQLKTSTSSTNPTLVPFDFTGYTGAAQLRETFSSDKVLANFAVTFLPSGSTTGSLSSSGSVIISLTSDQTSVLPAGLDGVWDLLLFQGGVITRLLEGNAFISPATTKV